MKKVIVTILIIALVSLVGAGAYVYNKDYTGSTYYVKITSEGQKGTDSNHTFYDYTLEGVNKKGETKTLKFHETRDEPLKMNHFLKAVVNDAKGVISWEEVAQEDLPPLVLEHFNK